MIDPFEVMSAREWDSLLGDLADESLMRVMLTDREGGVLKTHGKRNELCERIREDRNCLTAVCSQTNVVMLEAARTTLLPVVEECEAGMLRLVIPVVRGGILRFQVTACGRLAHGAEVETFLLSKLLDMEEDDVTHLARSVTLVARRYVQKLGERFRERLNEPA
ncbi:MAG: PocR ligand-binding domain-containing protein, partial [Deltaproteobacteria bacterium]|nr:PocR ligand-binding domain-containing protein [Deltaproteobacteria bacterium]